MSRGGGNDTKETTTKAEPYGPSEPYLQDIMNEAASLYASGTGMQYYPGSTEFFSKIERSLTGILKSICSKSAISICVKPSK